MVKFEVTTKRAGKPSFVGSFTTKRLAQRIAKTLGKNTTRKFTVRKVNSGSPKFKFK